MKDIATCTPALSCLCIFSRLLDLAGGHVWCEQALAPTQLLCGFPDGVHAGRQPFVCICERVVQILRCPGRTGSSCYCCIQPRLVAIPLGRRATIICGCGTASFQLFLVATKASCLQTPSLNGLLEALIARQPACCQLLPHVEGAHAGVTMHVLHSRS